MHLSGAKTGLRFLGAFADTAKRFGIFELLERWVGRSGELQVRTLTSYLKLVNSAGLAYILNFSLMRVEEAWNLRADALRSSTTRISATFFVTWTDDENAGR